MKTAEISKFFAYGVSLISASAGVLVLSGILLSEGIPVQFRITFGVVLVLLGIYRFIVTRLHSNEARRFDE